MNLRGVPTPMADTLRRYGVIEFSDLGLQDVVLESRAHRTVWKTRVLQTFPMGPGEYDIDTPATYTVRRGMGAEIWRTEGFERATADFAVIADLWSGLTCREPLEILRACHPGMHL